MKGKKEIQWKIYMLDYTELLIVCEQGERDILTPKDKQFTSSYKSTQYS